MANRETRHYSGGFIGFNSGAGPGIIAASSIGGLTDNLRRLVPNGVVKVGGVSLWVSLVGNFTGGANGTNYTKPLQLGKSSGRSRPWIFYSTMRDRHANERQSHNRDHFFLCFHDWGVPGKYVLGDDDRGD
ncbi:MAG: hypothetical protein L0287_04060 [Anaerolineae bacterium]|nr:hypothetical protein [Anaerolineae bacterium]